MVSQILKPREVEGWAQTTLNPWKDRHYFRLGKVAPICNATINNFIQVRLAPRTANEFKCIRCLARLEKQAERAHV